VRKFVGTKNYILNAFCQLGIISGRKEASTSWNVPTEILDLVMLVMAVVMTLVMVMSAVVMGMPKIVVRLFSEVVLRKEMTEEAGMARLDVVDLVVVVIVHVIEMTKNVLSHFRSCHPLPLRQNHRHHRETEKKVQEKMGKKREKKSQTKN